MRKLRLRASASSSAPQPAPSVSTPVSPRRPLFWGISCAGVAAVPRAAGFISCRRENSPLCTVQTVGFGPSLSLKPSILQTPRRTLLSAPAVGRRVAFVEAAHSGVDYRHSSYTFCRLGEELPLCQETRFSLGFLNKPRRGGVREERTPSPPWEPVSRWRVSPRWLPLLPGTGPARWR